MPAKKKKKIKNVNLVIPARIVNIKKTSGSETFHGSPVYNFDLKVGNKYAKRDVRVVAKNVVELRKKVKKAMYSGSSKIYWGNV